MAVRPEKQKSLELHPGLVLGKFEILRKLAVGGMAEIYLARVRGTAGFEKLVVLKRILPHIAQDPAFVQMFLDEARLAATLQHPNIADVYEVGEINGEVFFTMEYVHGQDVRGIRWAARKRDEPIPLAIALAIIHGTAAALDYAHEKTGPDGQPLGLVHRDVSSSNVMISYDGAIKLLDFGIARVNSGPNKTQTGTLKGKIPYMSPEQCRGHKLDRRSDLFSLGSLMFEVTVGRRPFRGQSDFEVMEQIVHHGAPTPSSVVTGYPPELERIVMKLLERDIDARYQTAEELIHDLEPFLAQHRLWASSKPISKYMRLVFADRIAAWEQAQQQGISLSQHIASAPDGEISEVQTPASAFPGLRPLSQEMPATRPSSELSSPIHQGNDWSAPLRPSSEMSTPGSAPKNVPAPLSRPSASRLKPDSTSPESAATVAMQMSPLADPMAAPAAVEPVYPELKSGSGRRIGFIIAGLAVGALGIAAVLILGGGKKDAAALDRATPTETTIEAKPGEAKPGEAKPGEAKPGEAKPGEAKQNEAKPGEAKPGEAKPGDDQSGVKAVEDKPADKPVEDKPVEDKPADKPVENKQPPKVPVKVQPYRPPPKLTPPPPKPPKKDPKKDENWDKDSPFLPGKS